MTSCQRLVPTSLSKFEHFAAFYQLLPVCSKSRMLLEIIMQFKTINYDYLCFQIMEHYCRFVSIVVFVAWLLSPAIALPFVYNNTEARNSSFYNEQLLWNVKIQKDLIFYVMIVLLIIFLYLCYLFSSQKNDKQINDE